MAWNVFRFCTGLKIIGSLMILVVLAVVGCSYYAVVVAAYGPELSAGGGSAFGAFVVLLVFHSLLAMLLWSYFAVVLTDPGGVPEHWQPPLDEDEEMGQAGQAHDSTPLADTSANRAVLTAFGTGVSASGVDLSAESQTSVLGGPVQSKSAGALMMTGPGAGASAAAVGGPRVRFCRKCAHFKPPRCHHCSVCGRCILKMDHHCVWVVNCVGAKNYKFFLLFLVSCYPLKLKDALNTLSSLQDIRHITCMMEHDLLQLYTFLECTFVAVILLPHFIAFFDEGGKGKEQPAGNLALVFLAFVLNLAFSLSVMGFLVMHMSLVLSNTTTIEAYEKKAGNRWRFDIGRRRNFEQVFGLKKVYWLLPFYAEEDYRRLPALEGLEYPERTDMEFTGY